MSALKWIVFVIGGLLIATVAGLAAFGLRPNAGHIEGSVEIRRPASEVWPWMTEPDKQKQWIGWLVEVRQHSPTRATWVMEDHNNNNQKMEIEGEITESQPPYYAKGRLWAEGMFTGTSQYRLTDLGGSRTKVEQIGDYRYEHWFVRLMEPLITPQAKKKLDEDLARLKEKVEAGAVSRR